MQHSRPPQFPLCPSFKKHRSSLDNSRFTIDHLTLPKPVAAPVWASLPTPPMSGSPPPEPSAEPAQIAGRRRKRSRSYTPPTTAITTAAVVASPVAPLDATVPRPSAISRGGETIAELAVQPGPYALNYPLPPASYQSASSLPSTSISGPSPRLALSPVSPRATRKPKAHVASACVNCKKKHLRCDSSRPCRRCVQSGKEVRRLWNFRPVNRADDFYSRTRA
ncbi:Fungal Zn2-Cys6 binuclear cluster domain-containing protein isoform 2 [Cladophialophora immunda]|nr:Fungal Zn2-Cys6 binuclear cluster domain-containing protein isoform 2 [Cladophialophora immunda]